MDWTAGYASDIEYTAGFYREQSPGYLNFVCLLNGFEAIPLDKPFTYFELGFGRGLTANVQAAANPKGHFYAADFNPAHVCGARSLAEAAQLTNLTLLENSFADLAQGKVADLPQFDFITMHGIYTWVTAENRQHIVDFVGRYLKPGGIVYLSYNALPGWSAAQPLQRLLVEHADLHPNRSDLQMDQAKKFVDRMMKLNAGYFVQNPNLDKRLETLRTGNTNYLVHEYMHRHWQPMYYIDVAREMAGAKLNYVGSAELPLAFPILYLTPEKQQLLGEISDAALRETMKDYFMNTAFRKDVFVRGARTMTVARRENCLRRVGLALTAPRHRISLKMKLSIGEVSAKEEMYLPILEALAQRPHSLLDLLALPTLADQTLTSLAEVAVILTASGHASPYFLDQASASDVANSMNRALAEQASFNDEFQVLVSPLLANGIHATFVERLVYLSLQRSGNEIDATSIALRISRLLSEQGRRLTRNGEAIATENEHMAELVATVEKVLVDVVPVWRQLGII
ncbi:class I SAM-dependent methyltransferase [Undibacterium sp. TJN25]|uniref:class I SAM-dependent methyltransferase n=1 Tax=Undibacterium sp. TJN25 TaxID=3413056 RepID=UPI003BF04FD8